MSSYSLPSDKFYFRDKETEEAIDLWAPYAGIASYAEFAGAPTGTLATTITRLDNDVTDVSNRLGTLRIEFDNLNSTVTRDMNKFLAASERTPVASGTFNTQQNTGSLLSGIYELQMWTDSDTDGFMNNIVLVYINGIDWYQDQTIYSHNTSDENWYQITTQILTTNTMTVSVERFSFYGPPTDRDTVSGGWTLYRITTLK